VTVTNPRTARILIVAQRDVVREAVRTVLASAGNEVIEAADAGVALWMYGKSWVDMLFVDLQAPGDMDAGEFIRQLKRQYPDARIVAMSARRSYGVSDPAAVAKQLGATALLRVPFSRTDLLEALEDARA
jgi:CheY-like chemotaxis protein